MASKGKGQPGPTGDGEGEGKKSKKKHALSGFLSRTKDGTDKKSWFSFPTFLPKMQDQSRFRVSPIDKRIQTPPKHLSVHLQQKLRALNFEEEDSERKVVLGICAMEKKSNSKPMLEIIRRLVDNFERLQVFVFDEDTILNKPVEEWPIVNGFVSFFSHGFPLEKAIAYKNLRSPFIVNDLEMQYTLQSRPKVYAMMKDNNIPHPRFAVLDRDKDPDCKVVETEDSIEVNGHLFMKPFVEKPVDAEDHNIYIYFPVQAGGGSTRLFRKVKDRSSVYSRFCRVRTQGSYLYEDFMPTDGTDVKVYTVGPDYQHAEARKSPALDGKVERNSDGKEIRYPVLLTSREKMIARNICKVFKQNVCGFDLLRANGRYYVCDINGFSFVKTSSKYYDDCAKILGTLVMRACCPQLHIPYPMSTAPEDIPVVQTTSGSMMELRCVVAVIRHGDRTPKQKMKMEVKNKKFLDLFEKYGGYKTGHLKLKKPKQLQEVLDIVRHLLTKADGKVDGEIAEKKAKLNQLKLVLEMYGHFSGINRKVQLKYQPKGRPKRSSSEEDEAPREPSLLLILKWGGELTPAGCAQAENLGKAFRTLYPGGQGQFEAPGLGFLRLHSTFRHDLKIYASDEGRVQMTAAAFTKGMLALEGELTPIVVQMVKSANTNGLLDAESNTSKCQIGVKEKLKDFFNQDRDFTQEDFQKLAATNSLSLINAMQFVKNPFQMCMRVHEMITEFTARIRCLKVELKSRDLTLFNGESWELLIRRWAKLEKDFRLKNGRFDISKIPDIYDCIKYDLHYNQKTLQFKRSHELFMCSKALADIIIPQEYGITKEERLHIGQSYCMPLLRKMRSDLLQCMNSSMDESTTRLDSKYSNGVSSPERFVRTRLYFTSESHIHSLLSILRYGGLLNEEKDEQWKQSVDFIGACAELNYMSQIVLMMFEDPAQSEDSDERFHIELHFSPGAYTSCDEMAAEPKGMGFRPKPNRETVSETTTPTNMHEVLEVTPAQSSPSQRSTPVLRQCISLPDNVQEELIEAELFSLSDKDFSAKEIHSKTAVKEKPISKVRLPSPDPDTPEWDWGDEEGNEDSTVHESIKGGKSVSEGEAVKAPSSSDEQANSTKCGSYLDKDNYIKPVPKERSQGSRTPDTEVMQLCLPSCVERALRRQDSNRENASSDLKGDGSAECEKDSFSRLSFKKKTDPIHIKMSHSEDSFKSGHDDKRSRSLEDTDGAIKMEIDGGKKPTSVRFKLQILHEHQDAYERNYRTIHLPLSSDIATKPMASFFFYNQAPRALEGFSNVPLLHPLETLHNNLTFHQVQDFLRRITRTRFGLPDTSDVSLLASKSKLSLSSLGKGSELPSSSNSSGGPSSPVCLTAPVDLMKTLGMYIGTHTLDADGDVGVAAKDDAPVAKDGSTSQNDHDESLDVDMAAMTGSYLVTMNKTDSDPLTPQDSFEECQN